MKTMPFEALKELVCVLNPDGHHKFVIYKLFLEIMPPHHKISSVKAHPNNAKSGT